MSNAKWFFTCTDTSGKQQYFTVAAPDKITATRKSRPRKTPHGKQATKKR